MNEAKQLEGSCLCRQNRYVCHQPLFDLCFCHCSICRKLTGSSGGAYGSVKRDQFEWLTGAATLKSYSPTEQTRRYFCTDCGSYLLTEHKLEPRNVFISLGSVDSVVLSQPDYRQFVSSAPQWVSLDGDLPCFAKWPKL